MKTTLVVAVLALVLAGNAFAKSTHSYTAQTLSDAKVGKSKKELIAQKTFSATVTYKIRTVAPWRYAPRHKSCWSNVPWAKLCDQVRKRLLAHEWLYRVADARWKALYAPKPASSIATEGWLAQAFLCIHRYEGAWTSNTGNGYYGGLQMDYVFMRTYGAAYVQRWGTADNWPSWAQIAASARAYHSGRGFTPWPNTARACGLI